MDTYFNRSNAVLCSFVAAVFASAVGSYLSSLVLSGAPSVTVRFDQVYDMNINHYLQGDQANIAFSLNADLRSVFNWNTNQLFCYVLATYKTPKNARNEVMIWDRIVRAKEDALIQETHILNKYPLRDQTRLLRSRPVQLSFRYRYMPIVGLMKEIEAGTADWTTPDAYFRYTGGRSSDGRVPTSDRDEDDDEDDEDDVAAANTTTTIWEDTASEQAEVIGDLSREGLAENVREMLENFEVPGSLDDLRSSSSSSSS